MATPALRSLAHPQGEVCVVHFTPGISVADLSLDRNDSWRRVPCARNLGLNGRSACTDLTEGNEQPGAALRARLEPAIITVAAHNNDLEDFTLGAPLGIQILQRRFEGAARASPTRAVKNHHQLNARVERCLSAIRSDERAEKVGHCHGLPGQSQDTSSPAGTTVVASS